MNIMANSEPIAITLQKICNRSLHHSVVHVCGYHYYSLHQVPIIRKLAVRQPSAFGPGSNGKE